MFCFVYLLFTRDKKNNGVLASRPQVWMAAYMKDGTSNSDLVNEVMTQMNELAEHMEGSSSDPAALNEQIFTQVMGPEWPGRVQTFGLGPSPLMFLESKMNDVMEKQIRAIRANFQSRIEILESQLQAAGVPVAPVVAPSNPLHRQQVYLSKKEKKKKKKKKKKN
ncbi:hypothetical protein ACSBR2_016824 [Camellia fascicularis]